MLTIHETTEFVMAPTRLHTRPEEPISIPVVEGRKLKGSNTPIVAGFIPARLLIPGGYEIPYFDPRTKQGYQRRPQEARINQLANDLRRGRVDLPTAVLRNIRNREARDAVQDGALRLDLLFSETALGSTLYVVDGQHRILALEKLVEENPDVWGEFMIPFVCMLGARE